MDQPDDTAPLLPGNSAGDDVRIVELIEPSSLASPKSGTRHAGAVFRPIVNDVLIAHNELIRVAVWRQPSSSKAPRLMLPRQVAGVSRR